MQLYDQYGNNITLSDDRERRIKSTLIELKQTTQNLTKKDIGIWRQAWQMAINIEEPKRGRLLEVYNDVLVDNHLTGCISQRKDTVLQKAFRITGKEGKELPEITELFEERWFKDFCAYALDTVYFGHSLVEFGDLIINGSHYKFDGVSLIPRQHVIPEYGVIICEAGDEWTKGISYTTGSIAKSCIGIGDKYDLGLLLKVAPQSLSKKNMLAYWDQFGELFGMPIRIAKTQSREAGETNRIESMLKEMGAAAYGVFPDGTEIEIKESSRGDAFNVYDQRVIRANNEVSKAILGQTMTIDNGASRSQSEVHMQMFYNIINRDADNLRDVINGKLFPFLLRKGFPIEGMRFNWDEIVGLTAEQQINVETLLLNRYEIDPKYFAEKYNIPITGARQTLRLNEADDFFA
ncbi:MAG: phage portal protein family protein [Bacteroidales bacterium]